MLKSLFSLQIIMQAKCPECGSKKIGRQNSEKFCQACGFVIEDGVFVGS
jgi:transcription initiation factor TFIIIB Brf1 subunit/transcription initiation factor TFIIB